MVCRGELLAGGWREGGTGGAQVEAGALVVEFAPIFFCLRDFSFSTAFAFHLGIFFFSMVLSFSLRWFLSFGNCTFFLHNSLRKDDARCVRFFFTDSFYSSLFV